MMSFLGEEKPPDIARFDEMQARELAIFMERRAKYGNNLDNAKRFPLEHTCGLYLKCARMIRQIENSFGETGEPVDADTLIDLSNYCKMIPSKKDFE